MSQIHFRRIMKPPDGDHHWCGTAAAGHSASPRVIDTLPFSSSARSKVIFSHSLPLQAHSIQTAAPQTRPRRSERRYSLEILARARNLTSASADPRVICGPSHHFRHLRIR